jgi:DNA-binding response OmpR family regulator
LSKTLGIASGGMLSSVTSSNFMGGISSFNEWARHINAHNLGRAAAVLEEMEERMTTPASRKFLRPLLLQHEAVERFYRCLASFEFDKAREEITKVSVAVRTGLEQALALALSPTIQANPVTQIPLKGEAVLTPSETLRPETGSKLQTFIESLSKGQQKNKRRKIMHALAAAGGRIKRSEIVQQAWGENAPKDVQTSIIQVISRLNDLLRKNLPGYATIVYAPDESYVLSIADTDDPEWKRALVLRDSQYLLFEALWRKRGEVVSYAELYQALWNDSAPKDERRKAVIQAVCRLMKRLKAVGAPVTIISHEGVGYELHLLAPSAAPKDEAE